MAEEQGTVVTEEIRQKYIGMETSEDLVIKVEEGMIRDFVEAIGDPNPIYRDAEYAQKTPYGGIIAPPTFVFRLDPVETQEKHLGRVLDKVGIKPKRGAGHGFDEVKYFAPIKAGDVITARSRLADIYEKQGGAGTLIFTVQETVYTNQRGEVVAIKKGSGISIA